MGALVGAPNDPPIRPPLRIPLRAEAGFANTTFNAKNRAAAKNVLRVHRRIFWNRGQTKSRSATVRKARYPCPRNGNRDAFNVEEDKRCRRIG